MAQVPYGQGIPEVAPEVRTPDDLSHVQVNPEQFGAAVGHATSQAGQSLEGAGTALKQTAENLFNIADFQGKVNTDDQVNKWISAKEKILHGDPNATVTGPDGQPQPDRGFYGLVGREASDKRAATLEQLETIRKAGRENLQSPKDQLLYDEQTRRMYSQTASEIGSHTDSQWKVWAGGVNATGAQQSLTAIANNADNPVEVANHTKDLINFRVQQAQVRFGNDPTIKKQAYDEARQESLSTQLESIAVKDPAMAIRMLDKNKDIAGTKYDELSNKFRARADQQTGIQVGGEALKKTYEQVPAAATLQPAYDAVGQKYGISGSFLLRTHQLEGNGESPTGAKGPFQFLDPTSKQYGLKNPYDFGAAADAAARLAANNKASLTVALGRPPTDAELYLAHQQGAGGAAALLRNPDATAADALSASYGGDKAKAATLIRQNGGDPSAPAGAFTGMWTARFNGAAGAISNSRKASAYQDIASNPDLTEGARAHALQFVNQTIASQQIAEEADAKAKKQANDVAAGGYVTRILKGDFSGMVDQISNDPNLSWETKYRLGEIAQDKSGDDTHKAETAYGAGFWQAYKGVLAGADDPNHISDFSQILSLADRSTTEDKRLTVPGVEKLGQILSQSRKSVDDNAVNRSKLSLISYAKSKLSFNDEMLIPGVPMSMAKDPEGERIFNAQFVPKFEAAYDQWVKDKKNPWDFLTQENADKFISGMRSQREMAEARMRATNGLGEIQAPVPAPKDPGINREAWQTLTEKPQALKDGTPLTKVVWANALSILATHPTQAGVDGFNRLFGRDDGATVLKQLTGKDINQATPATGPTSPNLAAADKALNLTPQEKALYERHLTNLSSAGGVDNPDGSRSTLYQSVQEHNGKFYNVPTVWDGKRETKKYTRPSDGEVFDVPNAKAMENINKVGWDKFPSYSTAAEADERYEQMHKFMKLDTAEHLARRPKQYSIHDKEGPGPAGYVRDLLKSAVPQSVQNYISSKGQ